jgi:quercetin dioxygenase-like cupin family protein
MTAHEATLHRWKDIPREQLNPLIARQMITGERLMVTHIHLEAGAVVPRHQHENEQASYLLAGSMRFWLGDDDQQVIEIAAGEVLVIPSNLPHRALTLTTTLSIDIFTPPRQDWLDGTDGYLRGS